MGAVALPCPEFSAAERGGLIEARRQPSIKTVGVLFSAAERGGLIEATEPR